MATEKKPSLRGACEAALYWLEQEAASNEPGATKPDDILRVLRAALGKKEKQEA